MSWATWLLFTGVLVCCVLCCVCGVLGPLVPVHRCDCSVCCGVCGVTRGDTRVRCVVLFVQCPGPLGSCSPVCTLGVRCCVCGVLGLLAPVHRCARPVFGVACVVSWDTWHLFTGVHARCVVLRVWCPGRLGSCSPLCLLGVLCGACGVLGHLAPVHLCARMAGVLLCVPCPRPCGSCSPVCLFGVLCGVRGVLGLLAPVHRCARSVCGVVRAWCPGPLGSCSPVCLCCVLCGVCGVLGHLAPVHRCACLACCVVCAVSLAMWLPFTGVHARCALLCAWCPGPLGSCSAVCLCCVLCGVCGVLGHLAPVHRCVRVACVVLRVRCAGPLGSCSPVC